MARSDPSRMSAASSQGPILAGSVPALSLVFSESAPGLMLAGSSPSKKMLSLLLI